MFKSHRTSDLTGFSGNGENTRLMKREKLILFYYSLTLY